MSRSAFTIWELLLVIIVVLAVAAILFPFGIFPKHSKARQISCLSNEKQLGIAIIQYAQDNDGCLPDIAETHGSPNTWRTAIMPYAKIDNLFRCPSRHDQAKGPDGFFRSYAANYNGRPSGANPGQGNGAFADAGAEPLKFNTLPDPAKLIMVCEFAGGNTPEFNIDDAIHFGPDSHLLWVGHMGRSNYLFSDGHAKWLRPNATKDMWHRNSAVPLSSNGIAVLAETQKRAGN